MSSTREDERVRFRIRERKKGVRRGELPRGRIEHSSNERRVGRRGKGELARSSEEARGVVTATPAATAWRVRSRGPCSTLERGSATAIRREVKDHARTRVPPGFDTREKHELRKTHLGSNVLQALVHVVLLSVLVGANAGDNVPEALLEQALGDSGHRPRLWLRGRAHGGRPHRARLDSPILAPPIPVTGVRTVNSTRRARSPSARARVASTSRGRGRTSSVCALESRA